MSYDDWKTTESDDLWADDDFDDEDVCWDCGAGFGQDCSDDCCCGDCEGVED